LSRMTLRNNTPFVAQFSVQKGEQVIARIPGLSPGTSAEIPTHAIYQVVASAVIEGNTYLSAPLEVDRGAGFIAQLIQHASQGTYEFRVVEIPSSNPSQLQFQSTLRQPVSFTISKDGRPLQTVVIDNPFQLRVIDIGDTFGIQAIINGVTTDRANTHNPSAVVTATMDGSRPEIAYFSLEVT